MQSAELASLYHDLAQLLRTGLTLGRAADTVARGPLPPASRRATEALRIAAARGEGISGAFGEMPPLDRAVLAAGEMSGHLDRCLASLSVYHGALDRMRGVLIRRAAYPLFLVHFGALVLGLPKLVLGGGLRSYAFDVAAVLGGFYVVLLALGGVVSGLLRAARSSPAAESLLRSIPAVGSTHTHFCVARFCMAYGTQLEAGISVLKALPAAASVAGSARISRAVCDAIPQIERGASPLPLLADALPDPVARGLIVGEETGTMDQELDRWATLYRDRALQGLETLGEWIPRLLYFGVAALLAWKIVGAYQQVLSGYARALNF